MAEHDQGLGDPGLDQESMIRLRLALGSTVRALDRRTNRDDVPRTQMTVLFTVARHGRIPLARLAEFEGVNPTMLSRVVGNLEAAGLVRRVPDAGDRRVAHAEITPEGEKVAEQQREQRSALFAGLFVELPESDRASLLAAVPALEALAEIARSQG